MMKLTSFLLTLLVASILATPASASIIITEILADPKKGQAGDSNFDGVYSASQDEFVEIYNFGDIPVDLSQWVLSDAVKVRHIFPDGTRLLPDEYLVVFGGGEPMFETSIKWQIASKGSLGLNNTGDMVSIFDNLGNSIIEVEYDSLGGKDQSIALEYAEPGLEFILHSELGTDKLFSPGMKNSSTPESVAAPEPTTLSLLALGMVLKAFQRV